METEAAQNGDEQKNKLFGGAGGPTRKSGDEVDRGLEGGIFEDLEGEGEEERDWKWRERGRRKEEREK